MIDAVDDVDLAGNQSVETRRAVIDDGDFRAVNPRFVGEAGQATGRIVDAVTAIATAREVTAAQVALAWVLSRGDDIVPIPGTKRLAYLEQNLAAEAITLAADEIAALEAAAPIGATAGDRYPNMATVHK